MRLSWNKVRDKRIRHNVLALFFRKLGATYDV